MPAITIDISDPKAASFFEGVAPGDVLNIQASIEAVNPPMIQAYIESVEEVETEEPVDDTIPPVDRMARKPKTPPLDA